MQVPQLMKLLESPLQGAGRATGEAGLAGEVAQAFQDLMSLLLGEDAAAHAPLGAGEEAQLPRDAADLLPSESGQPRQPGEPGQGADEVLAPGALSALQPAGALSALQPAGDSGAPQPAVTEAPTHAEGGSIPSVTEEAMRRLGVVAEEQVSERSSVSSRVAADTPVDASAETLAQPLQRSSAAETVAAAVAPRDAAAPREVARASADALTNDSSDSQTNSANSVSRASLAEGGSGSGAGSGNPEQDASAAFQRFASQQARGAGTESTGNASPNPGEAGRADDSQRSIFSDAARHSSQARSETRSNGGASVDPASGAQGATAAPGIPGAEPAPIAPGAPAPPALAPPSAGSAQPQAAPPAEAVPLNVEWLAARGGGTARVRLHPAELGELQLTVVVRGQDVEVSIRAQEVAGGQAVLASRDLLQDGLAARDLRMDAFDVRFGEDEGSTREERDAASPEHREPHDSTGPDGLPRRPRQTDERPIFVQNAPGGPGPAGPGLTENPGVDLHV